MPFNPRIHHRRSIRLKGYDYTLPGAYFVTLVTWHRKNLFGVISNDRILLNAAGKIVASRWLCLPAHFPVRLDEWVIMPNHLHGIIFIEPCTGEASTSDADFFTKSQSADSPPQPPIGTQPGSLGAIIQNFKSITSRKIHLLYGRSKRQEALSAIIETEGVCFAPTRIWQRNYFERIIRNEKEWEQIREYISVNPLRWTEDQLFEK